MASLDLGKSVDRVGNLVKDVNAFLAKAGVDEKLAIKSTFQIMMLTCNRQLKAEEQERMLDIIRGKFAETDLASKYGLRIESLCRKPGNPCSKSQSR